MKFLIYFLSTSLLLVSCSSNNSKAQLEKTLKDNPKLISELFIENPTLFMEAFQKMAMKAKQEAYKGREKTEEEEIARYLKAPMAFSIRDDEAIRGNKDAQITIVEYSDYQCPFCLKGMNTLKSLLDKYPKQVRVIYKHLPIDSIHPQARLASSYYEAIRMKSDKKAFAFHDEALQNQQRIRMGEKYLQSLVKKLGLNIAEIKKLAKSDSVAKRIRDDIQEAQENGFSGTPGFIVAGVPVRGAYPLAHFEKIINRALKKN